MSDDLQGAEYVRGMIHLSEGAPAGGPTEAQAQDWWAMTSTLDAAACLAKLAEYGSADLAMMERGLAEMGVRSAPEAGLGETAIAFYLLGKISRAVGAYKDGRAPSDDTWADITRYAMMARFSRAYGAWALGPGAEIPAPAGEANASPSSGPGRFLVQRLRPDAQLPSRAHDDDAGWDLASVETMRIDPATVTTWCPTGLAIACPSDYHVRITGRSSTIERWGLQVVEGIIDPGYRGELMIRVRLAGPMPVDVPAGTRLAQLIVHRTVHNPWVEVEALPDHARGTNGYGSSGI